MFFKSVSVEISSHYLVWLSNTVIGGKKKNTAPLSQPVRRNTKTNHVSLTQFSMLVRMHSFVSSSVCFARDFRLLRRRWNGNATNKRRNRQSSGTARVYKYWYNLAFLCYSQRSNNVIYQIQSYGEWEHTTVNVSFSPLTRTSFLPI